MNCPLNQAVICTNWLCTQHGCQKRGVPLPVTTDTVKWFTCEDNPDFACQRQECANGCIRKNPQNKTTWSMLFQRGCICPPTSEQTCQNPDCGRRPRDRQV